MTFAMTLAYAAALAGLFGLLLGSFLNVVAYRLPRGESLAFPPSHCPSCDTPIKPYDNVPVLSWLWLQGRCRACRGSISARYPVVEAATALLLVAVVLAKGADRDVWLGLAFVLLLVPVTLIDLDHRIIPNKLMLLGTVVSLALVLAHAARLAHRAPDRRRRRRRLPPHRRARLSRGHGDGGRQARRRHGPVPGARRRPRRCSSRWSRGPLVGAAIIARKGAKEGRKTAIPFGPYLAFGGIVGPVRRRRHRRVVPRHLRLI